MLIYDRIDRNKRVTWLLMAAFVLVLGGLAYLIVLAMDAPIGILGVVGIFLIVYALISYFASTSVTLSISGAREVTKEDEPRLFRIVENISIGTGLPMPRVYVIEDSAPNAFATGRDPQHAHVVFTRGLLDKLTDLELEGVVAHEMSHIGNYDIRVMTLVVVLVGLVALLADLMLRWAWFGAGSRRGNRDRNAGPAVAIIFALALVAAVLAPLLARVIQFAVSRQREYLADASAALVTRYPEGLASALEKIARDREPLEAANKATEHLYIENPLKEHRSFLNSLFSTHPPAEERIRILRAM